MFRTLALILIAFSAGCQAQTVSNTDPGPQTKAYDGTLASGYWQTSKDQTTILIAKDKEPSWAIIENSPIPYVQDDNLEFSISTAPNSKNNINLYPHGLHQNGRILVSALSLSITQTSGNPSNGLITIIDPSAIHQNTIQWKMSTKNLKPGDKLLIADMDQPHDFILNFDQVALANPPYPACPDATFSVFINGTELTTPADGTKTYRLKNSLISNGKSISVALSKACPNPTVLNGSFSIIKP